MTYHATHTIEVSYQSLPVGQLAFDPATGVYAFQYYEQFRTVGLELAPLTVPLNQTKPAAFPYLAPATFYRLPAFIADSLPDAFGNALTDNWLATQGVARADITPLDRLAYLGKRSMGALEFKPALRAQDTRPTALEMRELTETARRAVAVQLANDADYDRSAAAVQAMPRLSGELSPELAQLIAVGTSAGGARAKAVVGYNSSNGRFVSGQFELPAGFEHWLLKFDVGEAGESNRAHDYGRIEYAYALMARAAGIEMTECKLLEVAGRAHFMTRRFDRINVVSSGPTATASQANSAAAAAKAGNVSGKVHLQTLCALAELDFRQRQTHDYNQLFLAIEELGLGYAATDQAFTRMVFNVAAANCDDHTKNQSFLMEANGSWRLAPAYDLTHAYRPGSLWVSKHLMSVNGKFEGITRADLLCVAGRFNVAAPRERINAVLEVVSNWPEYAALAGVSKSRIKSILTDIRYFVTELC